MTAKVDILTATSEEAITVPVQAVVKRRLDDNGEEVKGEKAKGVDEVDVVYLMEDGKAALRKVVTGVSDVLYVEITDGLAAGDEVVVRGAHDPEVVRAAVEAAGFDNGPKTD